MDFAYWWTINDLKTIKLNQEVYLQNSQPKNFYAFVTFVLGDFFKLVRKIISITQKKCYKKEL